MTSKAVLPKDTKELAMTRKGNPPKDKKERTSWRQQRERLPNSKARGPCNDKKRSTY